MSIIHLPFPPSQPASLKPKPLFYLPTCPKLKLPLATSFKPFCSSKVPSYIPSEPTTQNSHFLSRTFHSLNSLKPYVLSQRTPILFGWLCSLVSVYSLSKIVANIGKASAFMANFDGMRLRSEGSVLALLVLARHVASYLQQAFLWDAALSAVYDIRVQVFNKVLERDLAFFEGSGGVSAGDIAHRITAEASDVADTVYALLNTIVPSALQLIAMGMQMLAISPLLSLISATVIPCMTLVIAHLGEKLRKISKDAHLTMASIAAYLNEILPAILSVKVNNAELCENVRFQMLAHADLSARLKKRKMKALVPHIIQILYFGALCILFAGSLAISRGSFDSRSMVSFLTSLVFLVEPIQGVGRAYNELKQVEPAVERLFDMTRFKSMVMEKQDAADLNHVAGELHFCDISFKYGDNMPLVLNKLNLHIKAGETVALVGPSGGGKTTLAKLLLRLYDPSSGTVAENIGYRDLMKNIDMERVENAAQTANADEFIRKLPEGYRTNIGPRGSALSRGQKQRLAIARALYQNSSILILDEATSSLDSRSELLVRQAVERLMENHTVLVIAHRLETIKMAKRVFILNDGRVEELTPSAFLTSQYESLLSKGLVI